MVVQVKKLISLALVVLMLLVFAGCGGNSTESKKESGGENKNNSNVNNVEALDPSKYEHLRGTKLKFATWKNPEVDEDGPVIKAFEETYGIDVDIVTVAQNTYIRDIAGKITADDAPDVFFSNGDFPACLSVLQSIDAGKIDLNDSIWDQDFIKAATVDGKVYLLNTVGNIWNEVDCVFYNKNLLENNNITTPQEYLDADKWNLDALKKVMTDVKSLGSDYCGGYILPESLLGISGTQVYNLKDGKFSNGITDKYTRVLQFLAECKTNGLVDGYSNINRDEFIDGKVGIAVTNAFGLKKTGYWMNMDPSSIGFVPLPDFDAQTKGAQTSLFRGWGICKGAKNPEAAGLFLRYYLDVNNYDTSSAFISEDAEAFFFQLTALDSANKVHSFYAEAIHSITGDAMGNIVTAASSTPAQVSQILSSYANIVNTNVEKLNSTKP